MPSPSCPARTTRVPRQVVRTLARIVAWVVRERGRAAGYLAVMRHHRSRQDGARIPRMGWLVSDGHVLASAEVATSARDRRLGLLKRDHLEGAFVLQPCRWVHTIGMRFPVDVAYVDKHGVVVKSVRMQRHRIGLPVPKACWVIEAEAGAFERWELAPGDVVELRDGPAPDVGNGG